MKEKRTYRVQWRERYEKMQLCPYCQKKVPFWRKIWLTDGRFAQKCPHCKKKISPKSAKRWIAIWAVIDFLILIYVARYHYAYYAEYKVAFWTYLIFKRILDIFDFAFFRPYATAEKLWDRDFLE